MDIRNKDLQTKLLSNSPPINWKGVLTVIGACLLNIVTSKQNAGNLQLLGTINPYIASKFHQSDPTVTYSTIFPAQPLGYAFEAVALVLVILARWKFGEHSGTKIIMISGTFLISFCMFFCAFTTNVTAFIIVFGVSVGLNVGFTNMVPVWYAWKYFPNRKGLVTGICQGCFFLGTCYYSLLYTYLVNPYNIPADIKIYVGNEVNYLFGQEITDNVNFSFILLGISTVLFGVSGLCLVSDTKKEQREDLTVYENIDPHYNYLKDLNLWIMFFAMYFCFMIWSFMSVNFKSFGMTHIQDDHLLSYAGGIGAVLSSVACVFWGHLFDEYSFRVTMSINMFASIAFSLSVYYIVSIDYLYFIYVLLLFWNGAGICMTYSAQCGKVFKDKRPQAWMVVTWAGALTNISCIFIEKLVLNAFGYFWVLNFLSVCAVIAEVFILMTKDERGVTFKKFLKK